MPVPPSDLPSPPTPAPPRRASLLTLFLIVFIDLMGFGIVLPNLQLYGRDFGIDNYFILTMLGATYSLFQFLFAPLLGRWSDRAGRRPVLLLSQVGTFLGFMTLYAAHYFEAGPNVAVGITLLFASRVIDGVSGGNISTATAYVADITTPENRAKGMGLIGAAFGIGFVFGPLIGGLTAYHAGLAYVPLVAAAFSLTAIAMTWFTLPESLQPGSTPKELRRFSFGGLRRAVARPVIGPMILMFFANGIAFAGMEQTLSLLIQYRLFNPQGVSHQLIRRANEQASRATGYLFFFLGIIVVLFQGGLIHRLTRKFGEPALVITGPALIAIGLAIIGVPSATSREAWTGLIIGCGILAVGSSLFTPAIQSLISRHAGPNEQGEILGANQGMASLARALGPLGAGLLFQYVSPESPYFAAAAICAGVAATALARRAALRPPPVAPPTA